MSKADEKSKQYRDFREQCGIEDPVMLNEIEEACYEGYHQAEKDLELGWEDIEKIVDLYDDVYCDFSIDGNGGKINAEEHYQEVLKRFKNLKDGGKG